MGEQAGRDEDTRSGSRLKGVTIITALSAAGRSALRALAVPALLLTLLLALSATGSAAGSPEPDAAPSSLEADRDGDKIFDDLAARLAQLDASAKVDVIVTLGQPATSTRVDELEGRVGALAVTTRFRVVQGFAATMSKRQIELLARLPIVEHVEENSVVRALNDSAQSSFGVTKARLDAPSLDGNCNDAANATCAAETYGPADLVAAVIDTGIAANHLDLDDGKVIGFADCAGRACTKTAPLDDHGHGTHVAATIAGDGEARADRLYKGVAPAGALVGVKVLDAQGNGTDADVINGIQWVIDNRAEYGIEAINLSLGSSGCSDGTGADSLAVNKARAAGIVVLVAAGNEGPGTCTVGSPGAAAGGITVGAMVDRGAGGFRQASFSSRGPTADGRIKPDISAPGASITSATAGTTNQYSVLSGTSMATPFAAGVALLMLDANPALTPDAVKQAMTSTAIDWARGGDNKAAGSTGPDIDYGFGRLDAYAALASAGASLTAPPAAPAHVLREGTLSGTGTRVDYAVDVADTSAPIAATLITPAITGASATTPDFDLYLYNPSGTRVASAYTTSRQEALGYTPTVTGKYTLRVQSYSGSGSFFLDISAGLGAPAPPPPPPPPPAPDFAIAASPASASTVAGSATPASYTVTTTASGGYAGTVNLRVSGLPTGATGTFTPTSITGSGSSQLSVSAAATTATGSYPLTITGTDTSGSPTRSTSVTLVVQAASTSAAPASVTLQSGSVRGGSASSLAASDASYFEVNSTSTYTKTTAWYGTFSAVPSTLKNLRVTYKGKNSRSCTQTVAIWRFTTGAWVQLDSRSVSSELELTLTPGGTLSDYVSAGNLHVRVRCTTTSGSFFASGNLLRISYSP